MSVYYAERNPPFADKWGVQIIYAGLVFLVLFSAALWFEGGKPGGLQ